MRKNESKKVVEMFRNTFNINVIHVDATKTFLTKLTNISDPEKKEKLLVIHLLKFLKKKPKVLKTLNFWFKELFIQM